MSLLSRLWISIGGLLLIVFAVTLSVFGASGSNTLQEQLAIETENTARTLAQVLSLEAQVSGVDELDPVIVQLRLSPFTDLSEFQSVELRDPAGDVVFRSENSPLPTEAPDWFKALFTVKTNPATAPVMLGWNNWELSLTPFGGSAYDELWRATVRSAFAMLAAFVLAGVIGHITLSKLLLPLTHVVSQAAAIGQRRFTQINVPSTREFAAVARSMNELSQRIQSMLSDEAELLRGKKAVSDLDETTGLLNRDTFMSQFATTLGRENEEAKGSLALIRLLGLADMNREYGRRLIDTLLLDIGSALNTLRQETNYSLNCSIGRMNGADLCAIASNEANAKNLADAMQRAVKATLSNHGIDARYNVAAACIEFEYGDGVGDLMMAADNALAQSEQQVGNPIVAAELSKEFADPRSTQAFWQVHLSSALSENRMSFTWYPVKNKQGKDIHLEGMARITIDGEEFNAGRFMPWVFRLGLGRAFDQAVIMGAVNALATHKERLHVNLSADSVRDESFTAWLKDYLTARDEEIARLGFELSESAVLTAKERFGELVSLITPFGCQVGVEHMGYRPEIIAELGRLGPSYLKIDSLYTQDLQTNEGNRAVVSSLSGVAKSLGIDCMVEGISTEEDRDLAFDLGAKGASGRAIG